MNSTRYGKAATLPIRSPLQAEGGAVLPKPNDASSEAVSGHFLVLLTQDPAHERLTTLLPCPEGTAARMPSSCGVTHSDDGHGEVCPETNGGLRVPGDSVDSGVPDPGDDTPRSSRSRGRATGRARPRKQSLPVAMAAWIH